MAEKQNVPAWLERALDPSTPTTEANETVRTENNYFEDIGAEIIYPTIRMGDDGKLYRPENAMEEAIKNNDFIVVEGPPTKETAEKAMQISKMISNQINKARTPVDSTDKGIMAQEERMTSDTVSFDKGGLTAKETLQEEMPYAVKEGPLNRERALLLAQEKDPEGLASLQEVNAEDKADWLNIAQYYTDDYVEKSPAPIQKLDKFLLENAAYSINVPFGTEDSSTIKMKSRMGYGTESLRGLKTGERSSEDLMIDLPGEDKNPFVVMHESGHAENPEDQPRGFLEQLTKTFDDTILSLGQPVGKSGKPMEEAAVTALDLYRALHRKDATRIASSIEYLNNQYNKKTMSRGEDVPDFSTPEGLEELADNAVAYTLSIVDENNLYSDEEKKELASDIKTSFKENADTIIGLTNAYRHYDDTGDFSKVNMYVNALEEQYYTPPKMNEGGLMGDPLMLSETAEEEAEPKMGVGDYLQAGKELIEDFSPAGTAQSMIDAAEEAYKLATGAEDASFLDLGIAAMGAIPGGKTAAKVVDNASKVADEIAEASLEISKLDNYVPKKTVKAYKLFTKGEDGNLYPLFVDANKPLPVGEWIKANMPDYIFQAKNGRYYVPSKATAPKTESGKKAFYDTGERKATGSSVEIPDDPELRKKLVEGGFIAKESTKSVKAVAARPGWHAGDVPIAHHIGAMIDPATGGTKKLEMPNVRRDDQVWAEVELPADVDWQQEALRRANVKKDGEIDVGTAHITDMVPHGGSYRYKTNPNMTGEWLIGGELKINRVLDDDEVKAINDAAGVQDLPRYSEFMEQYTKAPTETGIMSAEGAVKKSPAVDMAINVRVDKKADLDYAEKLISGEKVYETRNSRSLDPYIGQRVGIAKTGDGKAQAIGSVEIGEPIEVDEKTFRELQDKHLVPEGSAFDVPKGGKKYLYPVSNPERFESPKDVGRGIVSRKIINKYAGGLMLGDYNRAES